MDKSIIKFLNYLKEIEILVTNTTKSLIKDAINKMYLNDAQSLTSNTITLDAITLDEQEDYSVVYLFVGEIIRILENDINGRDSIEIYSNFANLSALLIDKRCPLGLKDKVNVIMYFIKRNQKIRENKKHLIIDTEVLLKANLENFEPGEIKQLVVSGKLTYLIDPKSKLTPKEEIQRKEIIMYFLNNENNIKEKSIFYNLITEHYLNIEDTYNERDMRIVLLALKDLFVNNILLRQIYTYMNNKLEEREKNNKNNTIITKPKEKNIDKKQEKKYITEQEYKRTLKEIRKVYNLHDRKFMKEISYNEMLEILNLMAYIEMPIDEMKTFIMDYYHENPSFDISIEEYLKNRDKLIFYGLDVNYLDEILETLISIGIEKNEYIEWKNEFLNTYIKYIRGIYDQYDYELNLVNKR